MRCNIRLILSSLTIAVSVESNLLTNLKCEKDAAFCGELLMKGTELTWTESLNMCTEKGGYLMDFDLKVMENGKIRSGIKEEDYIWSSMKWEDNRLHSFNGKPRYVQFNNGQKWLHIPFDHPHTNCVKYSIKGDVWALSNCSHKLKALCFPTWNKTAHNECRELLLHANEEKLRGNILIDRANSSRITLFCEHRGCMHNDNSCQWVKDGLYIETDGCQLTLVYFEDPSSRTVSEYRYQGTYWCESWNKNFSKRFQSNKINVIFTDTDTLLLQVDKNFTVLPLDHSESSEILEIIDKPDILYKDHITHYIKQQNYTTVIMDIHLYFEMGKEKSYSFENTLPKDAILRKKLFPTKCIKEYYKGVMWNTTKAGRVACNDEVYTCRKCNIGNYTVSAYWTDYNNASRKYEKHIIDNKVKYLENTNNISTELLITELSYIIQTNTTILKESESEYNTTTRLLLALEKVILHRNDTDNTTFQIQTNEAIVIFKTEEVQESSPMIGFSFNSENKAISLFKNNVQEKDTKAAIVFPKELILNYAKANVSESKRIGFGIFENTSFLDTSPLNGYKPNNIFLFSKFNDQTVKDIKTPIIIYFSVAKEYQEDAVCVYWEHGGTWLKDGCKRNGTHYGLVVCLCNHLTIFSLLIKIQTLDDFHESVLHLISVIGCSLSVFGLSVIIINFIFLKNWRKLMHNKLLANLCLTLLCVYLLFLFGIDKTSDSNVCQTVAMFLHYFILSSFCWMFVQAVQLYLRLVKVMGTYIPHFMLKASVGAWGFPLLPVASVLAYDRNMYGNSKYCWIDINLFSYVLLWPLAVIITLNMFVFLIIIKSTTCSRKSLRTNQSQYKLNIIHIRMSITIFTLFGLNWIFGFLSYTEYHHLVFTYAFSITSSMQGFLLSVLFIIKDQRTGAMWKTLLRGFWLRVKGRTGIEMYLEKQMTSNERNVHQPSTSLHTVSSL